MTFGQISPADREAVITPGPRPRVLLANVPVWDVRPVETLGVARRLPATGPATAMPIEATLRLDGGRIKGEVANHTALTIRDVQLVTASGTGSQLARTLAPGATAAVDIALTAGSPVVAKGGVIFNAAMPSQGGTAIGAVAASQAIGGLGDMALVAGTDPIEALHIDGRAPAGSTRAVLVEPVVLQAADSLSGLPPQARLVSSYTGGASGQVDAYELELPRGLPGRVGLTSPAGYGPQAMLASAEVYDWDHGTWRTVTLPAPGQNSSAAPLAAGEIGGGVVRLRIQPSTRYPILLSATSLP
jgi:hypothetical protein